MPAQKDLLHIPVGHIPAGSGNALAKSIFWLHHRENEVYGVKAMVERIKERASRPIDLWNYKTNTGQNGISFLGFGFGIIADIDIDIESEILRGTCLSRLRFEIFGGLLSFCWLRNYRGGLVEERPPIQTRQIWGMNIPFGSETIKIAPEAGLSDGFLHVMTVKSDRNWWQEKINTVRFLLSLEKEPYNLPFVSVERHRKVVLYIEKNQRVTIDGEPLSLHTTTLEMEHSGKYGRVFSF